MIIFSKGNSDFFKRCGLSQIIGQGRLRVTSDLIQFDEAIDLENHDVAVIDMGDGLDMVRFVDILSKTARRNVSVILTDYLTEKSWCPRPAVKEKAEGRKRIIFRKGGSLGDTPNGDKLDIVIDTAATLSHEINNPLMAITGQVEMLLKNHRCLDEDLLLKVRQIGQAASRIRWVTEKLTRLDSLRFRKTASGRMINFEESSELSEKIFSP